MQHLKNTWKPLEALFENKHQMPWVNLSFLIWPYRTFCSFVSQLLKSVRRVCESNRNDRQGCLFFTSLSILKVTPGIQCVGTKWDSLYGHVLPIYHSWFHSQAWQPRKHQSSNGKQHPFYHTSLFSCWPSCTVRNYKWTWEQHKGHDGHKNKVAQDECLRYGDA